MRTSEHGGTDGGSAARWDARAQRWVASYVPAPFLDGASDAPAASPLGDFPARARVRGGVLWRRARARPAAAVVVATVVIAAVAGPAAFFAASNGAPAAPAAGGASASPSTEAAGGADGAPVLDGSGGDPTEEPSVEPETGLQVETYAETGEPGRFGITAPADWERSTDPDDHALYVAPEDPRYRLQVLWDTAATASDAAAQTLGGVSGEDGYEEIAYSEDASGAVDFSYAYTNTEYGPRYVTATAFEEPEGMFIVLAAGPDEDEARSAVDDVFSEVYSSFSIDSE